MAAEAASGPGDFVIPDALPVLPLRDAVVLPLTAVPLAVGQPRSVRLVDDVMRGNRLLALVAQRDPKAEASAPEDLHGIGTVGMIHQLMRAPDGSVRVTMKVCRDWALRSWVLSFGPHARVIAPSALATEILEQLEEARDGYAPRLAFELPRTFALPQPQLPLR